MTQEPAPDEPAGPGQRHETGQAPHAVRILVVLALANLVNFYDRTVPAIVIERIKDAFGFSDVQIGVLSGAFTVVYAVAGILLGRLADRRSRRKIMAVGLIVWSAFTALSGGAWSFASLLIFRLGVGIGEASYAPAANSMIFDAFPPKRRARAIAVFQMGIPVGLLVAFLSVGYIVEATDSWRIPFFVAAVPGLILALVMLTLPEPRRGASEEDADDKPVTCSDAGPDERPAAAEMTTVESIRAILRVRTLRWLILAGIGTQVPTYAVATFIVSLLERYFDLETGAASTSAGIILGVTGILALPLGGILADRASRRSLGARLVVGSAGLALAAPLTLLALLMDSAAPAAFVGLFAAGWFCQYFFGTAAYPAIADVIEPRLRATAVAVFFAAFYLLGGAFGPVITGGLSDIFRERATVTAEVSASAAGLHQAFLVVVPLFLLLGAIAAFLASRTVAADHEVMLVRKERP